MVGRSMLWAVALVTLCAPACDGDDDPIGKGVVESVEKAEQITDTENELLSKRDALFQMRRSLAEKREKLSAERNRIREAGGDTSDVDSRARALIEEERDLARQENELNESMQALLHQRREIMAALSSAGRSGSELANREASLAARERGLARREQEVAKRESALAVREEGLASKWKDSCATGSSQTVVRTVDEPGSSYTRKDVEPVLGRARREMSARGLLASDLPEPVRKLESEANAAMKEGDYGRARLAASQLLETIRSTRVNKAFIAGKIQRLNAAVKGKKLSARSETLFREATAHYGDAQFKAANKKLNEIYSGLQ